MLSPQGTSLGSAVFPSIFLGALSLSNRDPDPSTHRQAQGGEEDLTTMLRVMVRYSNHEAQTRRELTVEARRGQ
jgi:hypothetical protein